MIEEVIKQIPAPGLTEKQLLNLEAAINSGDFRMKYLSDSLRVFRSCQYCIN